MASSMHSDLVIRDEYFEAGFIEGVAQNTDAFNEASRGAIRLINDPQVGYYSKERFWDTMSTVVTRRDLTSTSAATGVAATQDEVVGVKVYRKAVPQFTVGALRTIGQSAEEFSQELGIHVSQWMLKDQLNAGLNSVEAALSAETGTLVYDYTGTGDLAFAALVDGLQKMGDAAGNVVCWVAHSKPFYDLLGDGVTNYKVENVAGGLILGGEPSMVGVGRPFVITDSAALYLDATTDNYYTLGLVPGAVTIVNSEPVSVTSYYVDQENVTLRVHMEWAYTITVKGYEWDTSNGGSNPTDATLATASNWDAVVADKRDKAGVYIKTT